MIEPKTETVTCSKCHRPKEVRQGLLTESQKQQWVCQVCMEEPVVERQQDAHLMDGKELLLEG